MDTAATPEPPSGPPASLAPSAGRLPASATLQPAPAAVAERIKGMFAPTYLTLISIIQGTALAVLAGQVEARYLHFDAVAWMLVAVTVAVYISVWSEYVQVISTYVWFPDLTDGIAPFATAVLELFLAHFAVLGSAGLRGYTLVSALLFVTAVGAFLHLVLRASSPHSAASNRDMHRALDRHRTARIAQSAASAILAFAIWAAYPALGAAHYALAVALVIAALHLAYLLGLVPYWNRVVAYAQSA